MKKLYFFFAALLCVSLAEAQNDIVDDIMNAEKPKREYVGYTFKTTRVISGHSVETTKKGSLDFRISHRFGDIADIATNSAAHTLAGFYAISDILFSFEYGVTDDFTLGVMGTKGAGLQAPTTPTELYSGFAKYRVLKQTKDFKFPMTITLFGNACVSGMQYDPFVQGKKFKDESAAHRFSYTLQAMAAVKATDWLSIQISPTFLWRNYIAPDNYFAPGQDKNATFYLGFSARAKFSKRNAFIFEYFLPLQGIHDTYRQYFPMLRNIKNPGYYPSLNVGMEFETGGHVFHINLTNTEALVENDFLPYTHSNWAKGQFRLGFTISRLFPIGKGVNPWNGKSSKEKKEKKEKKA